jgi:hypothetical protein
MDSLASQTTELEPVPPFVDTTRELSKPYLVSALLFSSLLFYCTLHFFLGHLNLTHFLFSALILSLYFFSTKTRIFLILAIPFVFKDIFFDFIRYVPFHWLQPIQVAGPYHLEKMLFHIPYQETFLLPHEYLLHFTHSFLDLICGAIYFFHEPVAIALIILFWRRYSIELAQRYAVAFLVMNLLADFTYLYYPAAAPWYVAKYGLIQPLAPITGDPAGLARLDQILGIPFATNIYHMSPVVFGAIPSMHAGFTMLGWLYCFHTEKKWIFLMGIFTGGIWFAAVYLQHHYVIDLLIGIFYAVLSYFFVEFVSAGFIRRTYQFLFRRLDQEGPRTYI